MGELILAKGGEKLDLTKGNPGLKVIQVGLGWDPASTGAAFDLDASAFAIRGTNSNCMAPDDMCYFNNKNIQGISLSGDNLTGEGDGDDEVITIRLDDVHPDVTSIFFNINIFDSISRNQTFSQVKNSYVELRNAENGERLIRFDLQEDGGRNNNVVIARVYRHNGEWKFQALGAFGSFTDLNAVFAQPFMSIV